MGLTVLDLYTAGSLAHSGTKDTGKGVGLPEPSPGFATWKANSALPNGVPAYPLDYWAHGGYFYLVNDANDTIYRFSIDADGNLTSDSSQTMANMGLVGTKWFPYNPALYNSSDGTVILCSYYGATATGKTPVIGKWDCDTAWPFTNVNAEWLSAAQQSYGSFNSGQICNYGVGHLNTTTEKLYITALYAGQVCRIDTTDGSVDGFFEPYTTYNATYPFVMIGFDNSDNPVGGGNQAAEGSGDIAVWDDTNPASWSKGSVILKSSASTAYTFPHWDRARSSLYGPRGYCVPMSPYERAALGISGAAWWAPMRDGTWGEPYLCTYNFTTGMHSNRTMAHAADRRAFGSFGSNYFSMRTVLISGAPWLVSFAQGTLDQEDEDPGGDIDTHTGLVLCPLGPGTVTYTVTASADATPKRLEIGIDDTADNYLFSDSPAKHRFRFKVNAGAFSSWRSGTRQLQALDTVVDSLSAWPSYSNGDTLTIEHSICSGWPESFATTIGNPGGIGDPTTPPIHSADIGPPREVRAALLSEEIPNELGGGLL